MKITLNSKDLGSAISTVSATLGKGSKGESSDIHGHFVFRVSERVEILTNADTLKERLR